MIQALIDRRVMLVEDDPMLLMALEAMMADFGCQVAGTAMSVDAALSLARETTFDLAVLDVNLRGELVTPVALTLAERRIPFVFATAFNVSIMPSLADRPLVPKPYKPEEIELALASALKGPGGEQGQKGPDLVAARVRRSGREI